MIEIVGSKKNRESEKEEHNGLKGSIKEGFQNNQSILREDHKFIVTHQQQSKSEILKNIEGVQNKIDIVSNEAVRNAAALQRVEQNGIDVKSILIEIQTLSRQYSDSIEKISRLESENERLLNEIQVMSRERNVYGKEPECGYQNQDDKLER